MKTTMNNDNYVCLGYGFKDRQQEARAVLVGSHYIGHYYMPLEPKYMFYIPLTTLLSGLFIAINMLKSQDLRLNEHNVKLKI